MSPDMNQYDMLHAVTDHPRMSRQQWEGAYRAAWDIYYSPEHVEALLRRCAATSANPRKQTGRLVYHVAQFYGTMLFENVHPLEGGYFRRKIRTQRRSGLPRENSLVFYPRRVWETLRTYAPLPSFVWRLLRMRARVLRDPNMKRYTDSALQRVGTAQDQLPRQQEAARIVEFPAKSESLADDQRRAA